MARYRVEFTECPLRWLSEGLRKERSMQHAATDGEPIKRHKLAAALLMLLVLTVLPQLALGAQERLRVVTTLPTYAAITREVTGDLAEVDEGR
jgi:hypothetical protein